jgi:hypothetical protein
MSVRGVNGWCVTTLANEKSADPESIHHRSVTRNNYRLKDSSTSLDHFRRTFVAFDACQKNTMNARTPRNVQALDQYLSRVALSPFERNNSVTDVTALVCKKRIKFKAN